MVPLTESSTVQTIFLDGPVGLVDGSAGGLGGFGLALSAFFGAGKFFSHSARPKKVADQRTYQKHAGNIENVFKCHGGLAARLAEWRPGQGGLLQGALQGTEARFDLFLLAIGLVYEAKDQDPKAGIGQNEYQLSRGCLRRALGRYELLASTFDGQRAVLWVVHG
jgi:hypothetical protein